jgi:hypothetical protein
MLAFRYKHEKEAFVYLMDALTGLSAFLCPANIPGFDRCPAIADGKINLCGGGMRAVVMI